MQIKIRDTRNATEWVNDLLNGAISAGMTDLQLRLHRDAGRLVVRARVNRVMQDVAAVEGTLATEAVNRIKTKAKIPTGPAQAIADGLYEHDTGFSTHDLRVALFPSVDGEAMALRLPTKQAMPTLADVKFNEVNAARVKTLLGMANGLLLMAGPMGAGKTTTMYAIVGELGGPHTNVFTVEDPVERVVPGAVQIQINENARNGWPDVLRGLRRSDLEVLMIGEIRNGEQANAAMEIGNAGAKVVSSIHANDSVGAVHQLLELARTSPRMLGNQLRGVVSQRLLRKVHVNCAGAGCAECNGSGYQGVQAIHEVLIVNDEIVQAMVAGASASKLGEVARETGMETLWQAARRLIGEGLTDHKEAERVLGLEPSDDAPASPSQTPAGDHRAAAPVTPAVTVPAPKETSDDRFVPLPGRSARPVAADPAPADPGPAAGPAAAPAAAVVDHGGGDEGAVPAADVGGVPVAVPAADPGRSGTGHSEPGPAPLPLPGAGSLAPLPGAPAAAGGPAADPLPGTGNVAPLPGGLTPLPGGLTPLPGAGSDPAADGPRPLPLPFQQQ